MCGIVGMAGDLSIDHRRSFHDMLTVCQMRGRDSTGAFRVLYSDRTEIAKAVGTPDILLGTKRYDTNINGMGKALVGHCRAKTFGAANYENSHPFKHGSLTGVHNGSLRMWHNKPGAKDFGTDSEWLYWWASEEGMENVLPEIDFCGVLVWWDEADSTLNFYRNNERTLWVTYNEDCKTMLWASEFWMFGPFSRSNSLWKPTEGMSLYSPLEPGKIFSYKIATHGKEAKDIFTLSVKDVDTKVEVRGHAGNRTAANRGGGGSWSKGGQVTSPFAQAQTFLREMFGAGEDELNDSLEGLGEVEHQPNPPERIPKAGESGTTPISGKTSSSSSSNVLDFRMGKTGSSSGNKPTLSLPSPNSKNSRQGSKDVIVTDFVDCSGTSTKQKAVSLREVLGVPYISCKTTNREWTEQQFDTETEGICNYCNSPIGSLNEVQRIFVRKLPKTNEEEVTFVCTDCTKDKTSG